MTDFPANHDAEIWAFDLVTPIEATDAHSIHTWERTLLHFFGAFDLEADPTHLYYTVATSDAGALHGALEQAERLFGVGVTITLPA